MNGAARPDDDPVRALDRSRVRAGLRAGLFGRAEPPPRVGRFELRHKLGEGASGVVYAAFDPHLQRDVAVKLLVHGVRDPSLVFAEAQTLAQLNHPNVLAAYDVGMADGVPFVVSELATSGTLRDFLASEPDEATRLVVLRDVLAGVAEAHERGIVHRDLKPENVFVGGGRARVGDFGLAGSSGRLGTSPVGTPAYMAPEVQRGLRNDPRSDQFSIGVLAFELLFGRHPFDGHPFEPARAPTLDAMAPRERPVAAVVLKAFAEHDADRHPSVRAFAAALEAALEARRRVVVGLRLGVAVLGLALVSGLVAFVVARGSGRDDGRGAALSAQLRDEAAERALIAEMGSLSRAARFAECADTLERRADTEALDRFWVTCADRASLEHVRRACGVVQRRRPGLVLTECDVPTLEARAAEVAGRPGDCVARLLREPPTWFRGVVLGRCRSRAPESMSLRAFCVYNSTSSGQDPAQCESVSER